MGATCRVHSAPRAFGVWGITRAGGHTSGGWGGSHLQFTLRAAQITSRFPCDVRITWGSFIETISFPWMPFSDSMSDFFIKSKGSPGVAVTTWANSISVFIIGMAWVTGIFACSLLPATYAK